MGLRGPGARPIKRADDGGKPKARRPKWKAKGLDRVERVVAFLESLPVTSGTLAGTKFVVRPWQRAFLDAVYAEDMQVRQVRTAVLSMGRKNGKTGLAAGLALCHLAGPEAEERGEVYSAANDRFQATKLFNEMVAIIRRDEGLAERINVLRHAKSLEVLGGEGEGSTFTALSADAETKMGLSPSFVVYDELGQASKRDLYDALDTAMGARDEPLMLVISTQAASDLAPMSELVDYGVKVRDGDVADPSFHLTLYAAPEDADPWSRTAWEAANPALADFRSLEDVERQAGQAKRMPARESAFRNLILNQRVAAHEPFVRRAEWMAGAKAVRADLDGRPCWGGLDIGATRDLTAFVLVFPGDGGRLDVVPTFFLPGDTLEEREHADRVPYRLWREQGHLVGTPGVVTDPGTIARHVAEAASRFDLRAVAYDRWRIADMTRELDAIGASVPLVPWGQGFRDMSPAVDAMERAVAERRLRHGGHPVLTMCMSNAVVERDAAGNRKLAKHKAVGRIDGAVALAMALGAHDRHDEPVTPSCLTDELLTVAL